MRYLLFLLLFLRCGAAFSAEVRVGDKAVFEVPIAQTIDELAKGLMFVHKLDENSGMLFDFRPYQDRELSMWMKNTYIPLDMLFIGCDMRVVDVYRNAKPLSLAHIKSKEPYCFVLEINGGIAAKKDIAVGDRVQCSDIK